MQNDVNESKTCLKWRLAYESIKHYGGHDKGILHMASLLCRLYDEYDLENKIVSRALAKYPEFTYMVERLAWHKIPWFEKLKPRERPLALGREKVRTVNKETLDSLCFVLAADDKYFELLVECIESLKATTLYHNVDIKVLDVGLSRPDYFSERWGIEVIAPGWPVNVEKVKFFKHYFSPPYEVKVNLFIDEGEYYSVPCREAQYMQAVLNKPFLHELIPGYEYYFWIDADCWIQDERGLDKLITLAAKQGYAFPGGFLPAESNSDLATSRIPEHWHSSMERKPNNASSMYCNSKTFQRRWAEKYREAGLECGYWWGQEEEVASYCMDASPEIINFSEVLYLYRQLGFPVVKSGETILRNPETLEVIPVIGLGLDKFRFFYPVAEFENNELDPTDLINSIRSVGYQIDWSSETLECFTRRRMASLRYRNIPESTYKDVVRQLNALSDLSSAQQLEIQQCKNQRIEKSSVGNQLSGDLREEGGSAPTSGNVTVSTSSSLNRYEFIALREAQAIVKLRGARIEELECSLREAKAIVAERDAMISKLDPALREAQSIAYDRQDQIERLDNGLQNAQKIATELTRKNQRLDAGLSEAQAIVTEREKYIQQLEIALREAQELAWKREIEIEGLTKT